MLVIAITPNRLTHTHTSPLSRSLLASPLLSGAAAAAAACKPSASSSQALPLSRIPAPPTSPCQRSRSHCGAVTQSAFCRSDSIIAQCCMFLQLQSLASRHAAVDLRAQFQPLRHTVRKSCSPTSACFKNVALNGSSHSTEIARDSELWQRKQESE